MKVLLTSIPVQDPLAAHEIYTTRLGFVSREYDEAAGLAIVGSPDTPDGTDLLLEPCTGTFAETYQQAARALNLPLVIFGTSDVTAELARLAAAGVTLRPDLDRPDWGLENLFEDGCGNLIMIQETES